MAMHKNILSQIMLSINLSFDKNIFFIPTTQSLIFEKNDVRSFLSEHGIGERLPFGAAGENFAKQGYPIGDFSIENF